jgi:hypothetical protein
MHYLEPIKSKFTVTVKLTILFWCMCLPMLIYFFIDTLINKNLIQSKETLMLLFFVSISLLMAIGAFILFFKLVKIVNIDTNSQNISFKNILTGSINTYVFNELSGFYTSIREAGSHHKLVKVIFITKDNLIIGKIQSGYYSNFDNLESAISNLPFLGELKYSDIKSIKINLTNKIGD